MPSPSTPTSPQRSVVNGFAHRAVPWLVIAWLMIAWGVSGCSTASALLSQNLVSHKGATGRGTGASSNATAEEQDVAELESDVEHGKYEQFVRKHNGTRHELFDSGKPSFHRRALQKRLIAAEQQFAKAVGGRVAEVLGDSSRVSTIDADGLAWGRKIIELCKFSTNGDDEMAKYLAAYNKARKRQPEVLRFAGEFEDGQGSVRGAGEFIDVPMQLAECELDHATVADQKSDEYPYPAIHDGEPDACGEVNPKLACEESKSFTVTYYNQAQFYIARAAARRGVDAGKCRELLGKAVQELSEFHDWYKDTVAHGGFKSGITYKTRYMGKLSEKQILANMGEMTKLADDRQDGPWCSGKGDDALTKFDGLTERTADVTTPAGRTEATADGAPDDVDSAPVVKKKSEKRTRKNKKSKKKTT